MFLFLSKKNTNFLKSEPRQYAYQFEQYAYFFLKTSLGYAYK